MKILLLFSLVNLLPSVVLAGGFVAVTDDKIPQFKQIVEGAKEALPELKIIDKSAADSLAASSPDVVLAIGAAAFASVKDKEVTFVYCMVPKAMADGSKAVAGVSFDVPPATQLELFKQTSPTRKRIGVLYEASVSGPLVAEATRAAGALGLTLVPHELTDVKDIRSAATELTEKIDALWLVPDPKIISGEVFRFLLALMTEKKIPIYGFLDNFTQAGALASVSPDFAEIGRQAAKLAAASVGKHASGAPVPSPAALSINVKTAQQLGVSIDASVLSKAKLVVK